MSTSEFEGREPGDVGDDADALPDVADVETPSFGRDVDEGEVPVGDDPGERPASDDLA